MASRLLLTLLALLASLAAQFTPAQARSRAAADTEIGALASNTARKPALSAESVPGAVLVRPWRPGAQLVPVMRAPLLAITSVLQGIDRARQ